MKGSKKQIRYILFIAVTLSILILQVNLSAAAGIIVAKVNNEIITQTDFTNEWESVDRQDLTTATITTTEDILGQKKKVLDQLVDRRILFLQAKKENIPVDQNLIEQELAVAKLSYKTETEFQKALQKKKLSVKEYRDYLADDLRIRQILLLHVYSQVTVTNVEIELFYALNSTKYTTSEQVKIRSIFIKVPETATAEQKGEKLATAKLALMKVRLGTPFEEVARTMSDSENAVRGGDAGYITRGTLKNAPEIEEVAFRLAVGEVSEVIETRFGYYIIKVEGKIEGRGKRLAEVRERVKNDLYQERTFARYSAWLDELRNQYKIELFPENIP